MSETPTSTPILIELNVEKLHGIVKNAAAIRCQTKLMPVGHERDKVFPPTFDGAVYAEEHRLDKDGEHLVPAVLLDSVASQANRMEEALRDALNDASLSPRLEFPVPKVDFTGIEGVPASISVLEAPHRIFDAIFRDSEVVPPPSNNPNPTGTPNDSLQSTSFRDSPLGQALATAALYNATPLFEYCPTVLLFGAWNSTDAVPGKVKFARALVSEIVAYYAEKGVKVGGRIDPLGIEKIGIYRVPSQETTAKAEEANYRTEAGETKIVYATATNGWTTDVAQARKTETGEPLYYQKREGETWTALEGEAARDKEGNLVRYKLKKEHVGKPSEINHGNIPPAVAIAEKTMEGPDGSKLSERNKPLPGGITMRYAEQTTVLSMAALRRLRFPVTQPTAASPSSPAVQSSQPNSEPIVETETSATPSPNAIHPPQKTPAERDVDARMMLTALGLAVMVCSRQDYFLRSRCDLYAPELIKFEIVQQGSAKFEEFTLTLAQAATLLRDVTGQSSAQWKSQADLPTLRPSQKLADLIRESRRRSGSEDNSE